MRKNIFLAFIALLVGSATSLAQTTAFTYQGKLTDTGGAPLTGNYDLQFKLFDMLSGGTQVGATLTFDGAGGNPPFVAVTGGIFTVTLDFGSCPTCFNGAARFLEIAVKPHGGGSYTTLLPRQPITSTPYALKTPYVTVNGAYDDGTFIYAGANTFVGERAGMNTLPNPAPNNSLGKWNAFFGAGAGQANNQGSGNAFFGFLSGLNNTTGSSNSFFGSQAGNSNDGGQLNTFIGGQAGYNNVGASTNTFIGVGADFNSTNPIGNGNTLLGIGTKINSGVNNSTAIGGRALVTQSNSLILGSINGLNGGNADTNVGIGTTAPKSRLHLHGNDIDFAITLTNSANTAGQRGYRLAFDNDRFTFQRATDAGLFAENQVAIQQATGNVGIGTTAPAERLHVVGNGMFNGTLNGNVVNATTQFNLGGNRVLSVESNNLFAGIGAGTNNTGGGNSFFGIEAGQANDFGGGNSFFGFRAGNANIDGFNNAFFGFQAGQNTTGDANAFFGRDAGFNNTIGVSNTFIGAFAHFNFTPNPTGDFNTLLGSGSRITSGINNATAIGSLAQVTQSNSLVLGSINGVGGATADTKVGIGTTAPQDRLDVNGILRLGALGSNGGTQLCRNAFNQIANCSSSRRYKSNIATLHRGLRLINRLRPVTFDWKQNGEPDLGLVAEEVEKVEPRLVTRNDKGEIEGVKYDRVGVVLINAVKEQQAQITQQQRQIESQRRVIEQQQQQLNRQAEQVEVLKKLVCSSHHKAGVCK